MHTSTFETIRAGTAAGDRRPAPLSWLADVTTRDAPAGSQGRG